MDLAPHLASLRAAAGIARLAIGEMRADGFDVVRHTRNGDVDAAVSLIVERTHKTPTLRLRTAEDPGLRGLVLRMHVERARATLRS